jgi:choline kinase
MKVALRGGLVEALGKHLPPAAVHGENVGILRFEAAAAARLLAIASAWVRSGREREWVPAAVSQLARERPIAAHDIAGWPWTEIDFPEDLEDARHRIAPSLAPVREARLASETRR